VLAFAITLLVLDIALRPPGLADNGALSSLAGIPRLPRELPDDRGRLDGPPRSYQWLERVDALFLRLNLLFLLTVAFLPFPTRRVVGALNESTARQRMAAVVYGLTLLLISAAVRRVGLVRPKGAPAQARQR
jgi:uncharacterized membrane protein